MMLCLMPLPLRFSLMPPCRFACRAPRWLPPSFHATPAATTPLLPLLLLYAADYCRRRHVDIFALLHIIDYDASAPRAMPSARRERAMRHATLLLPAQRIFPAARGAAVMLIFVTPRNIH